MLHSKLFSASLLCVAIFFAFSRTASADFTINGNFETGNTSGWTSFPSGNSTFAAINSPLSDVFAGAFSGKLENLATGSAAVIKQANLGVGVVLPFQQITISFWAKGSGAAGGVQFAEFFSEISGGGTSSSAILGGGPLALTDTYTLYQFTTTTGSNVTGGVTLQFNAATGANVGSRSTIFVDNVSVSAAIPEPSSTLLILGGLGMVASRRRRPC